MSWHINRTLGLPQQFSWNDRVHTKLLHNVGRSDTGTEDNTITSKKSGKTLITARYPLITGCGHGT